MHSDVHVVAHTHWDREWYLPHERFRQRLVALVDELIDDPPAPGESFLLDGQAIVVEDYLAVRPDRRDALVSLLRAGRLEAGPWYVLADELIPSGEAIVRNLLTGRRFLDRLGATIPPVLYCPDSFGHPAALPAIAAGFGLPLILAWRGYGSPRWPAGDTVEWLAPDGEGVVLFHLPRDGYEYGSHLPADPEGAAARWARMRAELLTRSTTGVTLVQNGADHHARQTHFRQAIAALERAGADDGVHASSMSRFAARVVERASANPLPTIRGELRDSYGYTWTLQGTFATRAHEKRMNARAERSLLREAEPWAALASARDSKPLLDEAWRTLLGAHPHDTLCGCSIDEVADAMELRVRSALNQARGIRDDAIAALIGHDAVAARTARDEWTPIVTIRNAAPRRRAGVAIVEIERFIADVPVGPGSALATPIHPSETEAAPAPTVSGLGRLQLLSRMHADRRTESPRHYPDNDLVEVVHVAAWVDDTPPYGLRSFPIGEAAGDPFAASPAVRAPDRVVTTRRGLRNAHVSIEVDDTGRVTLEDLASRRRIASLLAWIDEADVGDLYTPAPRARPCAMEFRGVRRTHGGPLRGELELRYRVLDGAAPARRRRVDAELTVRLTLDAAARHLGVRVDGVNHREDHRLRLAFATGVTGASVWADAAFGPVLRRPIAASPEETRIEAPPPTAPLHRYVSTFDDTIGFTLFSDGLAEYEHRADGSLAVTLVRSVGALSRNDIPERPGHAGWPTPTPKAQCLGPFSAELAVLLHGRRDRQTIDLIERTADDVLLPLTGTTLRSALHVPPPVHGVELVGEGLALSAIKPAEAGDELVVRCVNLLDEPVDGRWRFPFAPRAARLLRMDETPMSELETSGNDVAFHAGARAIVTIGVRR